jgi:hypothetical protein
MGHYRKNVCVFQDKNVYLPPKQARSRGKEKILTEGLKNDNLSFDREYRGDAVHSHSP